ncbi:MAG TPA: GNAT family N-acetyltransferase [Trebonia sp.]|jgi:GNAT superfamily N-acetyltransferase|nr:GNAT family N-acetyltransferase [Trebonia sp.]
MTEGAGFVREARASDAPGLARIQVASWRASLAGLVPAEILDELSSAASQEQFAQQWLDAITDPPTSRHHVHVATGSVPGSDPVGFASAGPATDEDKWPGTDAELYELHVQPDAADDGHGARLLHAVAATLAEDGFRTACAWALSDDQPRLEFLESAGWAPDGAHGNLDMGVKVHVVRLHTQLSPEQ